MLWFEQMLFHMCKQGYFLADCLTLQESFPVNLYTFCGLITTVFLNMQTSDIVQKDKICNVCWKQHVGVINQKCNVCSLRVMFNIHLKKEILMLVVQNGCMCILTTKFVVLITN